MLPRVRRLEREYADSVVVIGVHSGKYRHERKTAAIAAACERLGVDHPVVNDRQLRIWRDNSVAGWPTLTIVDPEGYVVGQQSGELPYEGLAKFIEGIAAEHERKGTLNQEAASISERREAGPSSELRFPGNLAADIEGRLAISDTGNHRIVFGRVVGDSLEVQKVIGGTEAGFADGSIGEAAFNEPQGLALSGDMLIVADRGNHAVRMVDLASDEVATMAGTGELAGHAIAPGNALDTSLRSPWDVLLWNYDLFIAMAGSHQIWRLDLKSGQLAPHAGSGAEHITDGPPETAALAQPMALATDGEQLFFADAESSGVRTVGFEPGSEVTTLIGTGLFDFGDVDGVGDDVRLQHPAGLAWGQGVHRLWIADTYNHKLKMLEPGTRTVETVEPFEADLDEPMGLASAGHMVYVADTNQHRILRVDQIDKRVVALEPKGLGD